MLFSFKILLLITAYLLGSIPSSVWIGRYFYGIDVRESGSGNAGTTNTLRVLGWKAALPVLVVDIFKGFVAVCLAGLTNIPHSSDSYITFQIFLGVAALVGHVFPIYVGFKGGKGVATLCGLIFAIVPVATLISMGIFFITLLTTKYVSLSSLVAGFTFPISVIVIFKTTTTSLIIFSIIVSIILIVTHQKNIKRLLKGVESKVDFFKSRNKCP